MYKPPFNMLEALYRADCAWGAGQHVERDAQHQVLKVYIHLFAVVPKVGYITKELPLDVVEEEGYPVAHLITLLRERAPNFLPVRRWVRDEGHYRVELRVAALGAIGEVVERSLVASPGTSEHTHIAQMALKQMAVADRTAVFDAVGEGLRACALGKQPLLSAVCKKVQDSVQLALHRLEWAELNAGLERSEAQGFALMTLRHACEIAPLRAWRCWVHFALDEPPGQEVIEDIPGYQEWDPEHQRFDKD